MKSARWLWLVIFLLLALLTPFFWVVLATRLPAEWNPSLVGMERDVIHRTLGDPTEDNFGEKRMELWARDSAFIHRVMEIHYGDPTRPAIATEIYLRAHGRIGIFTRDEHEEFVLGPKNITSSPVN